MSDIVEVSAGEAKLEDVARGLLDAAASLGLPADVVEWSPSRGAFRVPAAVAVAYAGDGDHGEEDNTGEEDGAQDAGSEVKVSPWVAAQQQEPPSGPRRYTDEEKAIAVSAVNEGKTVAEAAELVGASPASVSKWVAAAKEESD